MASNRSNKTAADAELLRNYILLCPHVSRDSPAIAAALSGLDTTTTTSNVNERLVSSSMPPTRKGLQSLGTLLRVLLLDSPLILIVSLYMSLSWVHYVHDNYLSKQIDAAHWTSERKETDMTYYARPCFEADVSTTNGADLFLPDDGTPEDAYQLQLKHGFTVFPNVLSDETSRELRTFIDSKNHNLTAYEANFVLKNKHRYSFGYGTDTPEVAKAMHELTTNKRLKESMEKILGKNPAIIEMTAITSSYGAVAQLWHNDVISDASAIKFARAFGPSYSTFIVLQNTTKLMGATDICPGTHVCDTGPVEKACEEKGFQLVGEHGYWRAGDVVLMNMNTYHRGPANMDPHAPDRVMLALTWVPQPRSHAESRQMAHGTIFSLPWYMWGRTWNDLEKNTVLKQPWAALRALGLYKDPSADWGIDYISGSCMRMVNRDNGFLLRELVNFVKRDGGFKFLPSWLHGHVEDDESTTWYEFLLETLERCEKFANYASVGMVGAYSALYLLISLVAIGVDGNVQQGMRRFRKALFRLGVMIGAVLVLYKAAITKVDHSQWASDLRQGLRYTSPFGNEEARFDGPTVFPHRNDVLIDTRYKSEYLAMYNDFIGNHPGNRVWNELVDEKASTFASYIGLQTRFRSAVAEYIVGSLYNTAGRFLYQNEQANFVEISQREAVLYTKEELVIRSNKIRAKVMTQLEYLISEAKYGHLRKSVMSKAYTFPFLVKLQSQLLGSTSKSTRTTTIVRPRSRGRRLMRRPLQYTATATRSTLQVRSKPKPSRPVNLKISKRKPSPYSYLKEGRIVEVELEDESGVHWHKAKILEVMSTGDVSVVLRENGKQEEVHRLDIRPFVAPKAGEMAPMGSTAS